MIHAQKVAKVAVREREESYKIILAILNCMIYESNT